MIPTPAEKTPQLNVKKGHIQKSRKGRHMVRNLKEEQNCSRHGEERVKAPQTAELTWGRLIFITFGFENQSGQIM